jgi:NAD(P)-dependent dehydrogenase (short-subunit alcohol dehydrogenase family)
MKVLITGGMGVIGAETSRRFVKEGHRPVIFARHRDDWLVRDILDKVDVELGDVRGCSTSSSATASPTSCMLRPSSARCRRPIRR